MEIILAEALLRRKELQQKLDVLRQIDSKALYETRARRIKVTDSVDDVVADVPKLTASEVTREYDFYAKQLRHVDAAIQQCNWGTKLMVPSDVLSDYQAPAEAA